MDYKRKYLKYKNKYLNLKKQYGGNKLTKEEIDFIKSKVSYFTLKAGTILYRTQSEKHDCKVKPSYDEDTGKVGMYFANTAHIPIGMILEYKKPLNLCVYKTTKDLKIYYGKYSFRNLEPELFFESFNDWENEKFKLNTDPKNKEVWNHFDNTAYPLNDLFLKNGNREFWGKLNIGEIFLADGDDIEFVKFEGLVTVNDAQKYLEEELVNIKNNFELEKIKLELEKIKLSISQKLTEIINKIKKK
jgi:hypothetical protein